MEFCASVIITQGGRPLQYSKGLMENCPKTFGAVCLQASRYEIPSFCVVFV